MLLELGAAAVSTFSEAQSRSGPYRGLVTLRLTWEGGQKIIRFLRDLLLEGRLEHPQHPDLFLTVPKLGVPELHVESDRLRLTWKGLAVVGYKNQLRSALPDLEILQTPETAKIFQPLREGVLKLNYGARIYLPKPLMPRAERLEDGTIRFLWDRPLKVSLAGLPLLTVYHVDMREDQLHIEMGKMADIYITPT